MSNSDPYEFDRVWPREGTDSIKWEFRVGPNGAEPWDGASASRGDEQVLPLWVADMDFAVAPEIAAAVQARAAHSIYGYANVGPRFRETVVEWMRTRNGWDIEPEWIVPIPGIVPAMHLIVRRFTERGDGVLLQRPVYHPFSFAAENNGRVVRSASLKLVDQAYEMAAD